MFAGISICQVSEEAFKCPCTSSKLLTIYTTYIRPRMEYNSNIWAGASAYVLTFFLRIQEGAKVLIKSSRVSNPIESLDHCCNVSCVSLFYCYWCTFFSSEIRRHVAQNRVFLRSTYLSLSFRTRTIVVDWPMVRKLHYKQNLFISLTICMWNSTYLFII